MKKWIIAEKKSDDIIEQLLAIRGISSSQREIFLNPNYDTDLHNPRLLTGIEKAADKIFAVIESGENIGIVADYDADGVPGAALLYETLEKLGAKNVIVHIPLRSDGYGLSKAAIDELYVKKIKLIITIDLGITAKKEVEYAKKKAIDVIITDHHEIQKEMLPTAFAVINPKLNNKYPFPDLCGTAVVFKLCQMMAEKSNKISQNFLKWQLDLVGISTICDIVPLIDENRVLAKYGLIVLQKTKRLGLKKLYQASSIETEKIDPYVVGFQIGPRLNAGGRIKDNYDAFRLLVTKDEKEAEKLAAELNRLNQERQKMLGKALEQALAKIEAKKLYKNKVIAISDKDWSVGIVGLVAGRIAEKFSRPTIVLSHLGEEMHGSARSVEQLPLVDTLSEVADYLIRFGGHKKAAGLALKAKDFDNFYKKLLEIAEQKLVEDDLSPKIQIDAEIFAKDLNFSFLEKIKKLEPFGLGNPRPNIMAKAAFVSDISLVGKDKNHLKLKLFFKADGQLFTFSAIGFSMDAEDLKKGDKIDIVFQLAENYWNGDKKLEIHLLDFRKGAK